MAITQGQVVRLAERLDALGLELVPFRGGGWAVRVETGIVAGPLSWASMVQWVCEVEAERRAWDARVARARQRRRAS